MSAPPLVDGAPAIELREATVRFGSHVLLDRVDLEVASGRAVAVVGTNGSGKSALLRLVAGLNRPSSGRVRVSGHDVLVASHRTRRLIGYVPDRPGLAERLTPREHLELVAAQHNFSRADRQAAADSMLELVDLVEHARHPIATLSRGQRRRLALALALVHDPAIVLLDEPFDGIDDVGRDELVAVLLELRAMAKTILIASESRAEVAEVCDATATLVHGRLEHANESAAVAYTWIEVVDDPERALRALLQQPGVDDIRHEGNFITVRGPTSSVERAVFAEWLLQNGVHLSGFGATSTPAGGHRG
jgi:ABC-2 type transport system ATP-binding protein